MPYPLDGEESESSEPTTPRTTSERVERGVSFTDDLRRMQTEINRISHQALEVEPTRIRSSDMAQEVAETARNASLAASAIPTMEDALRYATRQVTAAEIAQRQFLTQTRHDWPRLGPAGSALERNPFITTAHQGPPRPEALMHPSDRPVAPGERRGPNSILYSRPFRELLRAAVAKAHEYLDLWGDSDIEVTEEGKLEELAERRAEAVVNKELLRDMKLELEKAQAQLSQAVVVMNNLTIDAVLREVTLTGTQRQQIEAMKYEP